MFKNKLLLRLMKLMMGVQVLGVGEEGGGGETPKPAEQESPKPAEQETPKPADEDPKPAEQETPKADPSKPSDNEAKLLREMMEKKGALKAANEELAQVKEQLGKFDGIDLEEVKTLLQSRKDAENQELEKKGEWDRLKANLIEQQTAEKTQLQTEIDQLKAELQGSGQMIDKLTIESAFEASRYIEDELTLTPRKAKIIYGSHFDFEGDKIIGYDKPKGATDRTMLIDSSGEALSFDAAMTNIIANDVDKDHLIRAKVKPGANSGTQDNPTPAAKPVMKGRDRISAALRENS